MIQRGIERQARIQPAPASSNVFNFFAAEALIACTKSTGTVSGTSTLTFENSLMRDGVRTARDTGGPKWSASASCATRCGARRLEGQARELEILGAYAGDADTQAVAQCN